MFSFLLFSLALATNPASAGDRSKYCAVKDCVCEVRDGGRKDSSVGVASITFDEDSSGLSPASKATLNKFLYKHRSDLVVVGHADACGNLRYNKALSRERSMVTAGYLKSKGARNVSGFHYGERGSHEHAKYDRRVDVWTKGKKVVNQMAAVKADVYLLDASDSMDPYWEEFVAYDYPPGSKIYLSKTIRCTDGQRIDTVDPSGGTEIYWSAWIVLQRMSPGQTLVVVSDFDSNLPKTPNDDAVLKKLARSKGIVVYNIYY